MKVRVRHTGIHSSSSKQGALHSSSSKHGAAVHTAVNSSSKYTATHIGCCMSLSAQQGEVCSLWASSPKVIVFVAAMADADCSLLTEAVKVSITELWQRRFSSQISRRRNNVATDVTLQPALNQLGTPSCSHKLTQQQQLLLQSCEP